MSNNPRKIYQHKHVLLTKVLGIVTNLNIIHSNFKTLSDEDLQYESEKGQFSHEEQYEFQ